jgi:serine/threonine protein kinase
MHRDIKPGNIVVQRASPKAVIIDFGAATAKTQSRDHMSGTIPYLAPEIIALKSTPGTGESLPPYDQLTEGDETQHLYVVSPTNLQLLMESAELSLSQWRSFGGWLRPWRSCDGLPADPTGSDSPECRDFTVARNLDCLRTL